MQYVEKKIMEVDYMLVQNHVHYNMLSKTKSPYGVMVQWLRTWLLNVEVKSSTPHTCKLSYLGYLGDLIKYTRLQILLDNLALITWPC